MSTAILAQTAPAAQGRTREQLFALASSIEARPDVINSGDIHRTIMDKAGKPHAVKVEGFYRRGYGETVWIWYVDRQDYRRMLVTERGECYLEVNDGPRRLWVTAPSRYVEFYRNLIAGRRNGSSPAVAAPRLQRAA